jgi:hypothetical protein
LRSRLAELLERREVDGAERFDLAIEGVRSFPQAQAAE